MTDAFLLDIWRNVCQPVEIAESVARAAPVLAERFPLETVLVRRVDAQRRCVETTATVCLAETPPAYATRTDCRPGELDEILSWCQHGSAVHRKDEGRRAEGGKQKEGADDLPSAALRPPSSVLLPEPCGDFLLAPLRTQHGLCGVLILLTGAGGHFTADHAQLANSLLEPFAIALENDRRVREMRTWREAAEADNRSLLSRLGRHDISESIVGATAGLRPVMQQVEQVAGSDVPVLIFGETGSGKEVVARAIHNQSGRAHGPFIRVNCGAIPPELVDSELFGHERGSFTGAVNTRAGWFERADGGTLFLDECGELPLAGQVRLLRILQDGTFERVGGERPLQVDVRIVAATHRDLRAMATAGQFREDLWYRLAIFPIQLPALRDRPEDIPALAAHFAVRAAKRLGMLPLIPSAEDLQLLATYAWPGNVRELAAVIERAAILGNGKSLEMAKALGKAEEGGRGAEDDKVTRWQGDKVTKEVKPVALSPGHPVTWSPGRTSFAPSDFLSLDAAMKLHIEKALQQTRGRIEGPHGAATLLGLNPHTLRGRMRKLGLAWERFRQAM